ncbi:MAG TPA: polyribonucleotide nucleotidyltransferase [Campylobacterales bacterium]|nr:polyribonucleotide nucleotidyltransferase [Campylobacterales bacterium]
MSFSQITTMAFGKEEIFETGKIARFADGSITLKSDNSVILSAVVSEKELKNEDFLPLTVQYIEKSYAAGKIPNGFIKRETKPSDFETLTSRLIDRSIRPLFPKGYNYQTQLTVTVFSCDPEADLQVLALNAASASVFISDLPVEKLVLGVRVAKMDGKFVANPSISDLNEKSTLDLFVAGTDEEILMIEMVARASENIEVGSLQPIMPFLDMGLNSEIIEEFKANEIGEEELLEAIMFASNAIKIASLDLTPKLRAIKAPTRDYELKTIIQDDRLIEHIKSFYNQKIENAITELSKSERSNAIKSVIEEIVADPFVVELGYDEEMVAFSAEKIKREILRGLILHKHQRPDGRKLNEVRPITIETNILPMAHGSCLFTRGQTQALAVATLGSDMDKQNYENLTDNGSEAERFMLHYNFPGFSVGEASRVGPPGRRELGHGNLAKRAIECLIPKDYEPIIRVVSEVLESNGSSSMATVCGGALAMRAANVPLLRLAAGIAMGLVKEGDKYAILSDIIGLEDYDGDMDFKVAGTREGVTALQMDIKLGGLDFELLKAALMQAKEGREHILSIMETAEAEITINESILPSTEIFHIDTSKIVDIIGQAGKTIKEIIERFEVAIDLDRDKGRVKVVGRDKTKVDGAKEHILTIAKPKAPAKKFDLIEAGTVVHGKVKKIVDFGAFVELPNGQEGLMHISKVSDKRINNVRDHLNEGDELDVKVMASSQSKVELANAKFY